MPKGGRRPGAGRKRGSKDRIAPPKPRPQNTRERVWEVIENGELTPLELQLKIIRDETAPIELRLKTAAEAAPYIHAKQPTDVNLTGQMHYLGEEMVLVTHAGEPDEA